MLLLVWEPHFEKWFIEIVGLFVWIVVVLKMCSK